MGQKIHPYGMRLGIVSPRVTIERVIPQLRTHIIDDATRSEFYKPARRIGTLKGSEEACLSDRDTVLAELRNAVESDVIPAYRRLLAFVEDEYLPACRSTVGIRAVPGGDRIYQDLIYLQTTVHLTPDEIHRTGLSEVKRIRREMAKVQKEVGFAGTLDKFLGHMRTDPLESEPFPAAIESIKT